MSIHYYRNRHPAGEYFFKPGSLTLSVGFGATEVEMDYDGIRWRGTSARWGIKVMPSGQERTFRHRNECSFGVVIVDDRALLADQRTTIVRPYAVLNDLPLQYVLRALWAEGGASGQPTSLFRSAVGQAIVARLLELDRGSDVEHKHYLSPRILARVIEYLHVHLAEDVTVDILAALAGLSAAHFSTAFRLSTGEPPHRYLVRLRVERARTLIEHGMSPSEAAIVVGFYDHSHLARHMRRLLGASPAQFRVN